MGGHPDPSARVIVCVDVDYRADRVVAAAVGLAAWTDADPTFELAHATPGAPAAYEPGSFYKRELPYLLAILGAVTHPISTIVIDGYVWLDAGHAGLGAHLHAALPARPIVVGVAKRPWRGGAGVPVLRGGSQVPLHVTAVGMPVDEAARAVASMHGPHRTPTLLRRTDRLARDHDRHGLREGPPS